MLACNQTITIIHHDKGIDEDTYICRSYERASWFKKNTITTSGDGAKPANSYEVRIMTEEDISIAPGDFVALGVVKGIEKPSDLVSIEHFRITAIGDNRRGKLGHWRVSGQ